MKKLTCILLIAALLCLCGCTIVPIEEVQGTGGGSGSYLGDSSFDPDAYAAENWEKIVGDVMEKAQPMAEVLAAYKTDKSAAGSQYGIRTIDDDTAPWNYIVSDEVKVLEVNRDSKKGRMSVDSAPFDGTEDYVIQVGPIFTGSAIRDAAEFIKFGDFKNQITFGDLGKSINKYANEKVIEPMKLDDKVGATLDVYGVFADDSEVLLMPVVLEEG